VAQLTSQSVRQLLSVLEQTRRRTDRGEPDVEAYRTAVRRVATEYSVEYPTIGDFRRRLGYSNIHEYREDISNWLRGEGERLLRRILQNSEESTHDVVRSFFHSVSGEAKPDTASDRPDHAQVRSPTPVEVRIRLAPDLYRRLQLAQLAGVSHTLEATTIQLLEDGFEVHRERIRASLADI
jgi:hypothetical protein